MSNDRSILLLPSLPLPLSRSSLRSAYKPTLSALFPKLVPATKKSTTRLDIALVLDSSYYAEQSRTALFPPLQTLLRETYTLVCLVAAQESIDLDLPGGLDVRIVFVTPPGDNDFRPTSLSGPLVNLPALASPLAPDTPIYIPETETALSLASTLSDTFRSVYSTNPLITHLPSGPAVIHSSSSHHPQSHSTTSPTTHKSIAVGGTFDHLHIGHKLLLTATLLPASPYPSQTSRKITVGVTDQDLLANKKHSSVLESWDLRVKRTAEFIESILCFHRAIDIDKIRRISQIYDEGVNGRTIRYTYTPSPPTTSQGLAKTELESSIVINYTLITDPFGPTITDEDISAIVISAETRAGGKAVNEKRKEKGWHELEVFEVGVLDATPTHGEEADEATTKEGFADKISSTEIRKRLVEMEKQGKL